MPGINTLIPGFFFDFFTIFILTLCHNYYNAIKNNQDMRKIILLFLVIGLASFNAKAQTNSVSKENWRPVKINPDGSNTVNGVSVFIKKADCKEQSVFILKVINSNASEARLIFHDKSLKPVTVGPSGNVTGSCEAYADAQSPLRPLCIKEPLTDNEKEEVKLNLQGMQVIVAEK
jgi:hypothetical protein